MKSFLNFLSRVFEVSFPGRPATLLQTKPHRLKRFLQFYLPRIRQESQWVPLDLSNIHTFELMKQEHREHAESLSSSKSIRWWYILGMLQKKYKKYTNRLNIYYFQLHKGLEIF